MLQSSVSDLLATALPSLESDERTPISLSSMTVNIADDAPDAAESTGIEGAVVTALETEQRLVDHDQLVRRSLVVCIESWEKPNAPVYVGSSLDQGDKAEAMAELVADFRSRLATLLQA